jgi:drug/metabolite transporter (DMT)-like permease
LPHESSRPFASFAPGLIAAFGFACGDVLGKVVLSAGSDVLTMLSFRSVVGLGVMAIWLRTGAAPVAFSRSERWIALGMGALFAATIFSVFKAIEVMDVPTAILGYFVYPLLTGIIAAMTGLERLGSRGAIAAVIAFLGLALMIGAHPGEIAPAGLAFAFGAAVCRAVMLLLTRAFLAKADARLITWYSLVSSTILLLAGSALMQTGNLPHTAVGWAALAGISIATTVAILAIFLSASRVGPFRTAVIMNLEPLLAAIGSAIVLDQVIGPLQALGGAIMLAALLVFQTRR